MNGIISTLKRIFYLVKCIDVSFINWKRLALLVFICLFSLFVCFTPYPGSDEESILQYLIFGQIG
jgi:hypothetical protein